jgi:predicted Zn-dependent protease
VWLERGIQLLQRSGVPEMWQCHETSGDYSMSNTPVTGRNEQRPSFSDPELNARWDQAVDLMEQALWAEARSILSELDAREQGLPVLINKIGVCSAEMNDLNAAEKAFGRALEADPKFVPAVSNLGNVALQRGNANAAAKFYQEAITLDPSYAIAHHNLSAAYKRLGKIDKAVASLKKSRSIEMRGEHVRGYPVAEAGPAKRGAWSCVIWTLIIAALVVAILFLR